MSIALLIIDMQEDFFLHERLSMRRDALSEHINELLEICRQHCADVVWIRQEFSSDLSDATLEMKKTGVRVVVAGTRGASILPELDFRSSDELVLKNRYSAFFGTKLDDLLTKLGTTQLIVAGINTHACIRTTVIDAYQRDYDIVLARDCIDSHDAEHHDVSWRYMDGKLGRGMSNEQIRSMLAAAA